MSGMAEALERVEIHPEGASLVEAVQLIDGLRSRLCEAVSAFDRDELWDLDGATSMTAWLRDKGRMSWGEASSLAVRARRLRSLPVTAAAWRSGELSEGQVGVVCANVKDCHVERFASHEAEVVPALVPLSVADTVVAMKAWADAADADAEAPGEPERSLYHSKTLDGRFVTNGGFDAEGGALIDTALRLARSDDVEGEPPRRPATRRADALVDVCRFFLDNQQGASGGRHRPHLNVVADIDAVEHGGPASTLDGTVLDPITTSRLLCDSALHRVLTAGRSTILDYGSATRTIPAPLWSALVIRDGHCRFPGCDRPSTWGEGHHIVHFPDGPTRLDNLVLLCSRHHQRCHHRDWQIKLLPDATVEVTDPAGRVRRSRPPPKPGQQSIPQAA